MSEEKAKRVKKPKSKARKIIEWVLTGVFLALFAVVLVGQIDGMVHRNDHFGYQIKLGYATFVVQTDSMEPEIPIDSAIITYLESPETVYEKYQAGETVDLTFADVLRVPDVVPSNPKYTQPTNPTGIAMTHRLQEIQIRENVEKGEGRYVFIVAGINDQGMLSRESQYQTFTEKQLLGTVKVKSNFLGGFFNFIASPFGLMVFLMIPALYLVITSVLDIFKAMKDDEPKVETSGEESSSSSGGVSSLDELSDADRKRLKEEMLKEMLNSKKGDKKDE